MKILDRYLIRYFLLTTIFCAVVLVFLFLIADVFDNLDELLRNHVTLRVALRYYLNLMPMAFVQIIQWASFLGLLHCLVSLNTHNEITAMKVSGLDITSIVRPLAFVGFLIGIVTFIVNDQVVPPTYRTAKRIQEERIEKKKTKEERKVLFDVTHYGDNRLYYAHELNLDKNRMTDFVILWLDKNKRTRKKALAREAVWDGSTWLLSYVNELEMSPTGQLTDQPASYDTKIYPELKESPEEFYQAASESVVISYRDLKEHLQKLRENGLTPNSEMVDLYLRLSSPWNSLILMFLSIPLLAKTTTRKAIAVNILITIAIVFTFHVSTAVALALGKAGKIWPFLSAWIGNVAFGFGALFFLDHANR